MVVGHDGDHQEGRRMCMGNPESLSSVYSPQVCQLPRAGSWLLSSLPLCPLTESLRE